MMVILAPLTWLTLITTSVLPPDQTANLEAIRLWNKGQDALLEEKDALAIECFEESLAKDPGLTRNYLSLAAVYLGKGNDERACTYMTLYLAANPEHVLVRGHHAELLCRLNRLHEAQFQYEQFIKDLQKDEALAREHLIQSHSKLMQIGERLESSYDEHLHRGIGLFLLARQYASDQNWKGEESREALLCRSVGELTLARRSRPEEARPHWYLYEAWTELVQSQPAGRSLRKAREKAFQTYLTPMERQAMHLAVRQQMADLHIAK